MQKNNLMELKKIARQIRHGSLEGIYNAKSGHPGGSLSVSDLLAYLYFCEMRVDSTNPKDAERDRLVLSKGHAAPALYAALAAKGFFPVDELKHLRQIGALLQGHPDMKHIPSVDMSTGSLGQGVSAAVKGGVIMLEMKKKATRDSYGEAPSELFSKYEKLVVLDADLAAATKTRIFKKAHPERFIDCGIAEGNMMGVAAGLATAGMIPFASSFAMFAAGRAFEQLWNLVGYPHLPVKIGATHAGISVEKDGATHQCNEDIALMCATPGMTVLNPAGDIEAKAAVEAAILHDGPVYLRFGRLATPIFNDPACYRFEIGKGICLREGQDVTIVATGLMVYETLVAAEHLAQQGIDARVMNIHTIKPLDEELITAAAQQTGLLVTVEEHRIIGGLGDAVFRCVCARYPVPVVKIGV